MGILEMKADMYVCHGLEMCLGNEFTDWWLQQKDRPMPPRHTYTAAKERGRWLLGKLEDVATLRKQRDDLKAALEKMLKYAPTETTIWGKSYPYEDVVSARALLDSMETDDV